MSFSENHLVNKDILSIQQMILPFINHNDANRLQMTSSFLVQSLPLVNGEEPKAQSIYNKEMVSNSDMITYAKEDTEVIDKIKLMDENFLLLLTENELELLKTDTPYLSSAFTAYHTYVTDKKKIKKGDKLLVTGNATKEGNLKIGMNALVGYTVYGENFEDSAIISESFAKRLKHVERDVVTFIINKNEYLLNLYGDENEYKCLPDIGSEINKASRIICAKRRVNHGWNSFIELSKESSRRINFLSDDDVYYSKGVIKDICIYSNLDKEEEDDQNAFTKAINKYIMKNDEDIKKFLSLIEPYLKRYKDKNDSFTFGPNLQFYYNKFRKIDAENVMTLNERKFNGYFVKIIIERECAAEIGTKIANTHGGKNIVTKILPDHKMPIRKEDGKSLDVIFSPNSVIGRLNIGQILETTLNRISEEVYKEFVSLSNEDALKLYIDFMKDLLPDRLHNNLNVLSKLKDKKLDKFILSVKESGYIPIIQVPFETIPFDKIKVWYNRYKMTDDIVIIDDKETVNPILTGYQYILKLKHLPEKKISCTSVRKFGSKTLQPSKDTASNKTYKSPISSSPNTLGEQETSILAALSDDMSLLKELIFLKSSDVKNRDLMLEKLFSFDEIKLSDFDNLESIAVTNLNYFLNVIGLTLEDEK